MGTSIAFFLSILLHETAHALMARRRGLEVRIAKAFGLGEQTGDGAGQERTKD